MYPNFPQGGYHPPSGQQPQPQQHLANGGPPPAAPSYVFFQVPPRQATPVSQPGQFTTIPQQPGPFMYQQPPGTKTFAHGPSAQAGLFYPQGNTQHQTMKPPTTQAPQPRERKTLAIVDPNTGKNILDDINNDSGKSENASTPQSGESSTSNTPQPSGTPPKVESVDIAAQFASQVAMKAAEINETQDSSRTKSDKVGDSSVNIISENEDQISKNLEVQTNNTIPSELEKTDIEKQCPIVNHEQENVSNLEVEQSTIDQTSESEVLGTTEIQETDTSKTELPTSETSPAVTPTEAVDTPQQEAVEVPSQPAASREQTPVPAPKSQSPVQGSLPQPEEKVEVKTLPEDTNSKVEDTTTQVNSQESQSDEKELDESSKPVVELTSQQNDSQSDAHSVTESMHKQTEVPPKSDNQSQVDSKANKEEEKMVQPATVAADVRESTPPSKEMSPQNEQSISDQRSEEKEEGELDDSISEIEDDQEKENSPEPRLQYNYKEDQWSPINPDGKRQYDRSFLLELQNNSLSLKKPDNLPNLEVVRDGLVQRKTSFDPNRGSMSGMKNMGGGNDFTPGYVRSSTDRKSVV